MITEWLAHPSRACWHLHNTATSSSWSNLIERWFTELTDKRLRRGVVTSVATLIEAITTWTEHCNTEPKPLIWRATAEGLITQVHRGPEPFHRVTSPTDHWDSNGRTWNLTRTCKQSVGTDYELCMNCCDKPHAGYCPRRNQGNAGNVMGRSNPAMARR